MPAARTHILSVESRTPSGIQARHLSELIGRSAQSARIIGCIAGALRDTDYTAKLAKAGFERIDIEPTRVYDVEDARQFLAGQGVDVDAIAAKVNGKFMSAFVRAVKPVSR